MSEDGCFIDSEKVIWELAPRKHLTYVQVIHKFKRGSNKGWTELCNLVNKIVQQCSQVDPNFVLYPYPPYCSDVDPNLKAYSIDNVNRKRGLKRMNKKDMAQEYVPGIWSIQQDKVKWLELFVGHKKPSIKFEMTPFVVDMYKATRTDFWKKPLQSNEERIVGWLGGTHIATFNTEWYSSILQGHKEFGKYPI